MGKRVLARAASALASLVLLAGCAVAGSRSAQPTWQPKPEGAPPADAPDPQIPGDSGSGTPAQPRPGSPGDANIVATGLRIPWGLVVLPDGTALVGERSTGRIVRVEPRHGAPVREVMRISGLDTTGDGGLLDLALSPTYRDDKLIFAYLTTKTDNRVVRFQLGQRPTPVLTGIPRGRVDNGGRLAFGPDGTLYVGTGDAGHPAFATDGRSLAGKVLRVTAFGRPAPGNPVNGSPVYTRGHPDVSGLCFDGAGRLLETEPGGVTDEINRPQGGEDYGWPRANGAASRQGLVDPVQTMSPATGGPGGCAVIDRGLFVTALRGERLWAFPLDDAGLPGKPQALLARTYGRLRTVVTAPDGALWLTTSNRDGSGRPSPTDDKVIRIVPPSSTTNSPA